MTNTLFSFKNKNQFENLSSLIFQLAHFRFLYVGFYSTYGHTT